MPSPGSTPLARRMVAEAVGTGLLVAVVVGSGIAAQRLSPEDAGLQLLENSIATALGLTAIISIVGPVSGAHLNPVISLADWWLGRGTRAGRPARDMVAYAGAQLAGAVAGAVLANLMFGVPVSELAGTARTDPPLWLGEVVATAGLITLVFALARSGRGSASAAAVGAYIGAAYWFTSSTSFANPAVTIGRVFSDTFAGISPASVPGFLLAQLIGLGVGLALVSYLYPDASVDVRAEDVVPPSEGRTAHDH